MSAGQGALIAHAAYVLARNGRQVMGDLRYLADAKIDSFESPLARAQLAAACLTRGNVAASGLAGIGAAFARRSIGFNQRAAASAVSSGRVLNAIAEARAPK
jgi:uncharacterized protein YfaS (alpha-2-macroglobulin family)